MGPISNLGSRNFQFTFTNRIPKQALQYEPKGRRHIGRPKKRWRDQFYFWGHKEQESNLILPEHDDNDDDEVYAAWLWVMRMRRYACCKHFDGKICLQPNPAHQSVACLLLTRNLSGPSDGIVLL